MTVQLFFDANLEPQSSHHFLIVSDGKVLLGDTSLLWKALDLEKSPPCAPPLFLGNWHDVPCFLLSFDENVSSSLDLPGEFVSLRSALGAVEGGLVGLAGRALQLDYWRKRHRFCGRCGSRNTMHQTELMMQCSSCHEMYYPIIAPCVIGVVRKGKTILLARNAKFREGLFSALAGFIEAGESVEDALAREVMEEVGIEIQNIQYVSSQSWPFPSQLMLGFLADYAAGDIEVDGVEITEADWFSQDNLPEIPPAVTISGRLIRLALEQD